MAIDGLPIQAIRAEHLIALRDNMVRESRTLEYKRDPYGNADLEKAEFLADITALANTMGGHVVIGMDEEKGVATNLCGVPAELDLDKELQRLESMARDSVQPRLPGLHMRAVPIQDGRFAIVVQVSQSPIAPHRVSYKGKNRYWARSTVGKYEPDVGQLRNMFTVQNELGRRIADYQKARHDALFRNEGFLPLASEPGLLLINMLPYSALSYDGLRVTATDIYTIAEQRRPIRIIDGYTPDINIDGVINWAGEKRKAISYVQYQRNGTVESVAIGILEDGSKHVEWPTLVLRTSYIEKIIVEQIGLHLSAIGSLGFAGPYCVLISLIGVSEARVNVHLEEDQASVGRDQILFDPVVFESLPSSHIEAAGILKRPVFDVIANAGGRTESEHFRSGSWDLRVRTPFHGP